MKKRCPYCQSPIVLDFWDTIEELENGGILLDVFEAWICEKRCGYYQRAKHKKEQ